MKRPRPQPWTRSSRHEGMVVTVRAYNDGFVAHLEEGPHLRAVAFASKAADAAIRAEELMDAAIRRGVYPTREEEA